MCAHGKKSDEVITYTKDENNIWLVIGIEHTRLTYIILILQDSALGSLTIMDMCSICTAPMVHSVLHMCKLHLCAEHVQASSISYIMRNMYVTCVCDICCLLTCMLQVCCTSVSYMYACYSMVYTHTQATSIPHIMCSLHTCILLQCCIHAAYTHASY